jgi:hypothetical protein
MLSPLPFLLAGLVAITVPDVLSWSGWGYTLCIAAVGWGMVLGPWQRWPKAGREARSMVGPGTLGVVVFIAIATYKVGEHTPGAEPTLGPSGARGRVLTRMFEERDGAVLGARLLSFPLAGQELGRLGAVMTEHYPRMTADGVALGTAILPTYLGWQSEDAFDDHVIDGRGAPRALQMVFLHGSGGSFSLLCWQVAISVRDQGVRTHCPAMGSSGVWASRRGRAVLEALLAELGDVPLIIAGLSAGSIALSRTAPELAEAHPNIVGFVLISGVEYDTEPSSLPTLLFHGERDRMTPIEPARIYAEGAGNVRMVTVPSGHFAILEDHETLERELAGFVETVAPR